MENAPCPITNWDDGMMSTMILLLKPLEVISKFDFRSLFDQFFNWFSSVHSLLLSHWLSWGNFVACRWVFSNQVQAFLFFNKALVCFRQNLNSWQNIKSLIARVSFFSFLFSWRYHRLGYGFGLAVGWRKEAFLTTWRCWRLTDKVTK